MSAKLLYSNDQGLFHTGDLPAAGAILGRGPESVVPTRDQSVAERHCRIYQVDGQWLLEDLDSPAGTLVNGKRVRKAVLQHRDVIRCGALEVQFAEKASPRPIPPPPHPPRDPDSTLNETKSALEKALAEVRTLKTALERSERQEDQGDRLRMGLQEENRRLHELAGTRDQEIRRLQRLADLRQEEKLAEFRANQELRQSCEQLQQRSQAELAEARAQIEKMRAERDGGQQELRDIRIVLERLRRDHAELQASMEKKEEQHGQLLRDNAELNEKRERLREIVAENGRLLEERTAGSIRREAYLRDDFQKKEVELKQALELAQGERDRASARHQEAQRKVQELQKKLADAQAAISPPPALPLPPQAGSEAERLLAQIRGMAAAACRGLDDAFLNLQVGLLEAQEGWSKVEGLISDAGAAKRVRESIRLIHAQVRQARSSLEGLVALASGKDA